MVGKNGDDSWLSPVAECRESSASAFLHFPHIELVFLFFVFEGAVGAQVEAMRHSGCLEVFFTATAVLVRTPRTNLRGSSPKLLQTMTGHAA